jgi:phosphoribosylformimino-5-aminoimidazole carboxamide ribotide isomerase
VLVFPAVDIRGGRSVRLIQGSRDREIVYDDDPVTRAGRWEAAGAPWVHVVDLDGAFAGRPVNGEVVLRMVGALHIPVQVGGGIRDLATIERLLAAGAARVVLGTAAATSADLLRDACAQFGERVAAAIDARRGIVVTDGWVASTGESALVAAERMIGHGVRRIIYTDTSRDGMLEGPNVDAFDEMLRRTQIPVIASGGISSVTDVRRLRPLAASGLEGVIVGRALYEGRVRLEDLLAAAA